MSDTNLYKVAADYLNDATQWNLIADLNGIADPYLSGIHMIYLPYWPGQQASHK